MSPSEGVLDLSDAMVITGQGRWSEELVTGLERYAGIKVGLAPFDRAIDALSISKWRAVAAARTVLVVGFRPGAATVRGSLFDAAFALARRIGPRKRVIYYWIGSDVQRALVDLARGGARRFRRASGEAEHFAGSAALGQELVGAGVPAEVVGFPWLGMPHDARPLPMPERFTVLSYVPDARPGFYGGPQLLEVALALPDADFLIVGGTGTWAADIPQNVRFLGWQEDMLPWYRASSCVVRLVEFDSTGGTVVEALAYGRPALYSRPLEHTTYVPFGDADRLTEELRERARTYAGAATPPDTAASEWALREFDPRKEFGYLARRLRDASGPERTPASEPGLIAPDPDGPGRS